MRDDRSNTPTGDILVSFFTQLQLVETNNRSLVIITREFVDLLLNTIINHKCKHGHAIITSNNRYYTQSVRLILMNELSLIDDRLFKILDRFRKFRNRAVHEPFFEVKPADLDFTSRSMERFVPAVPEQTDLLRFCMYLVGTVWNRHVDIMQKAFSDSSQES